VGRLVGLAAATILLVSYVSGCGPKVGALLHFTGLVQPDKTPAVFDLARKPLLILVDDDWDLIHPPTARDALVDALATELRAHKLVDKVTTNEELARVRQSEPNFEKRGAREIGRLAKADIVLWLKVVRFTLPDNLDAAVVPCYFGVSVKVLDAKAAKREDVCLWPKEREGKPVEARISPHNLQACKSVREAHTAMATALASQVAKLFYEHEEEQQPKQ
jgi:hypothetical protein